MEGEVWRNEGMGGREGGRGNKSTTGGRFLNVEEDTHRDST